MDYSKTIDFIKSVYGNQEFTPLAVPVFAGNEKAYLNECIDTTFVSSVGKFVDRFEEDMAKYTGAKKAVVCVSGTNALHMSLMLAGVQRDDEVLTQALTFIATCNALSYIGAHPVFLDVDKSTMGLSPDAMKEWLQKNAKGADIIYVDPPEMENTDEVVSESLPDFEIRLADALAVSICKKNTKPVDVSAISWNGLASEIVK